MWVCKSGNDARKCLLLFLRMRELQKNAETSTWRLLCFLFFWYRTLSTSSGGEKLLRVT